MVKNKEKAAKTDIKIGILPFEIKKTRSAGDRVFSL